MQRGMLQTHQVDENLRGRPVVALDSQTSKNGMKRIEMQNISAPCVP